MVLAAYLAGHDIIRECMEDEAIRGYLEGTLFQEIIPTRSLPREDCEGLCPCGGGAKTAESES